MASEHLTAMVTLPCQREPAYKSRGLPHFMNIALFKNKFPDNKDLRIYLDYKSMSIRKYLLYGNTHAYISVHEWRPIW